MPKEVLYQIFSHLNQHDLQAAVSMNKTMNKWVIEVARSSEIFPIKNFTSLLARYLNTEEFSTQRNSLIEITQDITSHEADLT
ncbi:MAG: hypothetical protein C5B45_06360 [Chlamydiae bacterium]|nr:MAG: hypothetical protein C5B45_06360 [Chlamydiota bacterium]